jgi:outer membrane protein
MTFANMSKALFAGLMLTAMTAHAEMKVAVVNFQKLVDEAPQGKLASQALQDEFLPRQRELQQKQKDLQAKQEKLQRDAAVMSETEKTSLDRELRAGTADLQSRGEAFSEELNTRRNEELGRVQGYLAQEVATFAKNGGYDLVIPTSVAVYAKDSLDITTQMLAYLQTRPVAPAATAPKAPATGAAPKATAPAKPATPAK